MTDAPTREREIARRVMSRVGRGHGTYHDALPAARSSLLGFTQYTYPVYKAEPVHHLIAEYLEAVLRGDIKRLIINAPPQIGKSEITSVRFPAYWLGKRPNDSIILSSYGASLAEDKSKQVRNLLDSEEYRNVFPNVRLSDDTRASDMWRLASPNRGSLKAAGVGGSITGFGAELGVIDDPVKDWDDGQSPGILEKAWNWYKGTFRPRLREDAAIVLIMTRWSIGDLAARLIKQGGFELLRLPAVAELPEERRRNNIFLGLSEDLPDPLGREPGQSIAPGRFKEATLAETESEVGPVVYAGEYQQIPRASEGGLFKRDRFNVIDGNPPFCHKFARFWDLALSEMTSADYTVGVLMGLTPDRRLAILDVKRYRIEWDEAEQRLAEEIPHDPVTVEHGIEGAFFHSRAVKKLVVRAELHPYTIRSIVPDKDNFTRALPFAARVGAGVVDVMRRGWTDAFLDELCAFPMGAHDDQVDAASGAYAMLDSARKIEATVRHYA